jgi:hypothetical protein
VRGFEFKIMSRIPTVFFVLEVFPPQRRVYSFFSEVLKEILGWVILTLNFGTSALVSTTKY